MISYKAKWENKMRHTAYSNITTKLGDAEIYGSAAVSHKV